MSNHPNRNWRRRWVIDPAARTATHDAGLVVRFAPNMQTGGVSVLAEGTDKLPRGTDIGLLIEQACRLSSDFDFPELNH